jgi:hypothetical protein
MRTLTIDEIKSCKRKGDLRLAADMIGVSQGNASKIFVRPFAKKHKKLIKALSEVIHMREILKQKVTKNSFYAFN